MSTFYSLIKGCRGAATRCGSKNSGIRASVQSWQGSIISKLSYDQNEELKIDIGYSEQSSSCSDRTIFYGNKKELKQFAELYRLFRAGELKLTRDQKVMFKKIN